MASRVQTAEKEATTRSNEEQKYIDSLRMTAQSLDIARETASVLSQQTEALDRADRNLDLTEATVKQANYIVRGMTWSGWLYNKFTKEPQVQTSTLGGSGEISMGFICPECRVAQRSQYALMEHYQNMHGDNAVDSTSGPQTKQRNEAALSQVTQEQRVDDEGLNAQQRAFLEALGPQLLEMKQASLGISNALDHHNALIDRIDAKTEKTKDDMRLVTANAIKLTNSSLTIEPQFRCALQEENSRQFLANINGNPVFCMDTATSACIFRAFTLIGNGDIWGFQHEESMKWLGITMFGTVKILGGALKSYEQFAIDTGREWTTLYNFASSFGQGGWLCVNPDGSIQCIRRTSTNKDQAMRVKLVLVESS